MIFLPVAAVFLLTPLREGRPDWHRTANHCNCISTHAPAGGATLEGRVGDVRREGISTHAPAGGATLHPIHSIPPGGDFYSRPCGRGDTSGGKRRARNQAFLLTPLREGRRSPLRWPGRCSPHFYSRPCGRGDFTRSKIVNQLEQFLLTPLREGRLERQKSDITMLLISTHAPAGGATRRTWTRL